MPKLVNIRQREGECKNIEFSIG